MDKTLWMESHVIYTKLGKLITVNSSTSMNNIVRRVVWL